MRFFSSKNDNKNHSVYIPGDMDELFVHDRKETATILFLAHRHYIKAVAMRYVPYSHLADEVVQQVYIDFVSKAEKWNFDGNIKSLLAVMTQNIARAYWKSESKNLPEKLQQIAEFIQKIAENDDQQTEHYAEHLQALHECLKKAPKKTGELVQLHYFNGMSFKEIASKMDINPDSVYRAVYRLREKLRLCIERVMKGEGAHV